MNTRSNCPIWGTPTTEIPVDRDGRSIDSPRAGGRYFVSGTAEAVLGNSDRGVKERLTTWLIEQHRLGIACPEISVTTINDATHWRDADVSDRADSILRYLATRSETLGAQVRCRGYVNLFSDIQLNDLNKTYLEMLAHSGCVGDNDLQFLLTHLKELSLIEYRHSSNLDHACTLTVEGYARLAELEKSYTASSRAFVAMWFDDSMSGAWEDGFEPAIRSTGYDPVRIDQQDHVNKIDDEIIAEIRRARFVVADFTQGNSGARGGVYYEAGFAHGLSIPVIFTCREESFEKIHFDTRQYNHIVWTKYDELRRDLMTRIAAVIGYGPNKPPDGQN